MPRPGGPRRMGPGPMGGPPPLPPRRGWADRPDMDVCPAASPTCWVRWEWLFTGDRDYRPVLMDRDIKKNCSVFHYLAVLFVFGRAVFRKGSCTFPMEKASALSHECRLSIPFFTENPSPILPESRMLSRASVLPRFVSAEIHLPF